jgi:phosphate:Na+ symporter
LIVIFGVLGGLAIFLFGLQLTGEAMQKVAGRILRDILRLVTKNPVSGIATGAFITLCTQSSSATTVFLVNFVNAGIMKFSQTIGVILGADIGTTFTVQLIAFRISDYCLAMVAIGFIVKMVSRYEREKFIGQALLGFGFIFLGMLLMKQGVEPLRDSEKFVRLLCAFKGNPLLALAVSTAVTAIIQSSAATLAIALTLAGQGLLGTNPFEVVQICLPIVFGANIGTCATAFLASIQSGAGARRVAVANVLIKIIGVAIFFPLMGYLSHFIVWLSHFIARGEVSEVRLIANAHTVFNVMIVVIILPFSRLIEKASTGIMRQGGREKEAAFEALLKIPELAFTEVRKKIEEMFAAVSKMVSDSISILREGNRRALEDLKHMDDIVDGIHREVTDFLARLGQRTLSSGESKEEIKLLGISHHLERLGDIVNGEFLYVSKKVIDEDLSFSYTGFHEVEKLHEIVCRNLEVVESVFKSGEFSALEEVIESGMHFRDLLRESYASHIDRMHKGLSESFETKEIHFHILLSLESMNAQVVEIAELIGEGEKNVRC